MKWTSGVIIGVMLALYATAQTRDENYVDGVFGRYKDSFVKWKQEVDQRSKDSNGAAGAWSIKERLAWEEFRKANQEFVKLVDGYYKGTPR